MLEIFRAYDIRGLWGKDINEEIIGKIGQAYGKVLEEKRSEKVFIARDVRLSSTPLFNAFCEGIRKCHIRVTDIGTLPLGAACFASCQAHAELAYITASHLPSEWNGIKFFHPNGIGWMENESSLIKEKFQAISSDKKNDYHSPDFASFGPSGAIESYVGYLISKHRPSKAIKVIIDCGNGAASLLAPQLFARAGFATTIINGEPNGTFPNRSPDPVAEELAYLQEEVVRQKADIGIAYDGDGDRMAIIDNAGMVLTPSQISYFILSELLKQAKGPVIANVECSLLIEDTAKAFNCKVIRVPVGHTYLMEAANANKAVFGVEFSGHYTMPQLVPFDDAMAISYWMACALASIEKALSAIVDEIPQYPFERINFSCSDSKKFDVMKKLEGEIVKKYPKTSAMDGIRVELLDGWALIRASNTEPKIRLTVEARTKEGFEKIKAQFTNILSKVM